MGRGDEVPMETMSPPPPGIARRPGMSSLAAAPRLAATLSWGVFWAGNVTPGCSGGKCDLWMRSRLHGCSSSSFPTSLRDFLSASLRGLELRDSASLPGGQRWCGDAFATGPLPALSLRGSHPSKAVIGGSLGDLYKPREVASALCHVCWVGVDRLVTWV